eukprot:6068690-Alexandrium_andersonii.AAC.1
MGELVLDHDASPRLPPRVHIARALPLDHGLVCSDLRSIGEDRPSRAADEGQVHHVLRDHLEVLADV